tara:strand:+ start:528 stop:662 length:135 start_codon:yes stop_codon:yes gene_type:complete
MILMNLRRRCFEEIYITSVLLFTPVSLYFFHKKKVKEDLDLLQL